MKKTAIIIGTLLILSGGAYVALSVNEAVSPQEIVNVQFSPEDFAFTTADVKLATSTDENGNEIRTVIKIPSKYDFPVATTTGFVIETIEEDIGMTFDGYNMCRFAGKTKTICLDELNDDIEQTVDAFKENKAGELEELQRKSFQDELSF